MSEDQFEAARDWLAENIEHLCLKHGPASWLPSYNPFPVEAGDDIRGLAWVYFRCREERIPFPVYAGHCDRTIYRRETHNQAFRAWHDAVHCEYHLGFKPGHEHEVCRLQCEQAASFGAPTNVLKLLTADISGQVRYYERHGRFPDDQLGFVRAYVNNPLQALNGDWR